MQVVEVVLEMIPQMLMELQVVVEEDWVTLII
jgi:hypothetical protein